MKRLVRKLLTLFLNWLELPGIYYTRHKYIALPQGGSVFPASKIQNVKVPPNITLHDAFFNAWNVIEIEDGVALGHQVMFLTGKHEVNETGVQHEATVGSGILIRQGSWLGSRVVVLEGVTIGEGSMIGAGSVVTRSVPDHEFWAGNPAKFIRKVKA